MGSNSSKGRRHKAFECRKKRITNETYKRTFSTGEVLELLIKKIAANMNAASLAQLDAALRIRNSKKHEIMTTFPGQVEKQAKAMMYQWLRSEPHPSVEKLLGLLQSVRLNCDRLLYEEKPPRAVLHPQQPEQGADEHQQPTVIQQQEEAKEENQNHMPVGNRPTTSLTISDQICHRETEREVKAEYPPAIIMRMLHGAPDPFTKPRALHHWLRTVCIVYDLRPGRVMMLLGLVYGSEWGKVKCHFDLPGAGGDDDDWPDTDAMITWLDNSCGKSIDKIAWAKADLGALQLCYQMPKELVTDFLERFKRVWDSTVDLPMEYNTSYVIVTLVQSLQPHVADLFKLTSTQWITCTFSQTRVLLSEMQRCGMLDSKRKALKLAENLQSAPLGVGLGQLQLPASNQGPYRNPRRKRRTDRCYYCGRLGHWARECRARIRENLAFQYY